MMEWEENEIVYLKNNYPNMKNIDISKYLNRSVKSINSKAFRLKLKKTKEHKSKMISKRNKMVGRDLTYHKLKEIASKYKTRGEFIFKDPSGYSSARVKGILDDICSHMYRQSYSIPQLICKYIFDKITMSKGLYNDRETIKPYELDIYYPEYKLSIEYNGKGWHGIDDNTDIKLKKCEESGIKLFVLIENSRRYEEDIKNQIVNKLPKINEILNSKLTTQDINKIKIEDSIFDNLLNEDEINNITRKYNNYSDFRKNETKIYSKLLKLKQINKFTSHMEKERTKWEIEDVKKTIDKYIYLDDLINNDYGCYLYIKKNKLEKLLKKLKYKGNDIRNELKGQTLEKYAKSITKNYEIYSDFRKNEIQLYRYLIKLKRIDEFTSHMVKRGQKK